MIISFILFQPNFTAKFEDLLKFWLTIKPSLCYVHKEGLNMTAANSTDSVQADNRTITEKMHEGEAFNESLHQCWAISLKFN